MNLKEHIRQHLVDGKLPEDYALPPQKAFSPQNFTQAQIKRKLRGVVRAVHRPDWARLHYNAAERRLFRIANAVPIEVLREPLKEAFLSRGKRLNYKALGEFVRQCLQSKNAVTVQCGLVLTTLLPYPRSFSENPVPSYLWAFLCGTVQMLGAYPGFRALAEESLAYLRGAADPERNPGLIRKGEN